MISGDLVLDEWSGWRISRQMRITSFSAHPIEWIGFDGPVGIRMELELAHPAVEGFLYVPKIAMTGKTSLSWTDYFYEYFKDHKLAFLSPPDFAETEAGPFFDGPQPIRISYDLYPGIVQRTQGAERICVAASSGSFLLTYLDGGTEDLALFASWWFYVKDGARVDLSPHLTRQVQAAHLWRDRVDWTVMLKRLEPDGLRKAGYTPCPEKETFAGEICFCPGEKR